MNNFYRIQLAVLSIIIFNFTNLSATRQDNNERNTKWNETWEDILKRDLLVNYDKNSRPSPHQNRTEIALNLSVKHVDLDELKGVVNLYGWLRMAWNDEKLKWNSSEYGGYDTMRLSIFEIWQPNLIVYNKATGNDVDHFGNTFTLVYNKGMVLWVPPFQTSFFCDLDFRFWPFDTQKCSLIIGSWVLDDTEVRLDPHGFAAAEIDPYIENNEWMIKNISTGNKISKYLSAMKYEIILQRRSPMYKAVVITPATCVILLTLSCFWLPPQSGEKIMLNGINLICITAFLVYFAQMLPTLAMNTPLVVLFYSSTLLIVSVSMMISVLILFISHTKHKRKVPSLIKKLLDGSFGKALCLLQINDHQEDFDKELQDQNFENNGTDEDRQIINQSLKRSIQYDWIILAMAIDRLCFIVYSIVFIILAAVYAI